MVFPGFLFHHVFLDRNGSTVRVGSRYFQTIEGTFRRRSIIRMIVTISRVRSTEKTYMFCAAETMYVKKAIEETE
jgi:hypothetical protein